MIIEHISIEKGGLLPEACAVLGSRIKSPLYNLDYPNQARLRHPFGIYNVSLQSIFENFVEVLDELDVAINTRAFQAPMWRTNLHKL